MDRNNQHIIASNLTVAFYNGQIRREPFLGEDRRTTFYSPDEENRIPTVSLKEVYTVYKRFLKMLEAEESRKT
jgi:hypothetical protein